MKECTAKWIGMILAMIFAGSLQASSTSPLMKLEYFYAKNGRLIGREVNGIRQNYEYDRRGQLLAIKDRIGNDVERYVYDPAGNVLSKTVDGKTTIFTYDKANQLVSSTVDGKTTRYAYDAAGRLVKEGDKTYNYGWLDKILEVQERGNQIAAFDYHINGQIASAVYTDKTETFLWDGLALIQRNEVSYVNEPYVTGGNPVLAGDDIMFNDMLGSTLGVKSGAGINAVTMTAFGETDDKDVFFTGKPAVGELGYAFLFRNYRADQGKWQTADPMGYPDGWNNLSYCNNLVTFSIDLFGMKVYDLCDRGGAGSYGHSAQVVTVQHSNGSWSAYTYNYGAGSSGSGTAFNGTESVASTEEAARNAAVQKLDPSGTKYDNMSVWNAGNTQSQAAKDAMDDYVQGGYNPSTHNCRGTLDAGLEAAGYTKGSDHSAKTAPAAANTEDIGLGTAKDLTQTLKNIQRGYAE